MLHEDGPMGVVVDFIEAIDKEQNPSFPEEGDKSFTKAIQTRISGDLRQFVENRENWTLNIFPPFTTANKYRSYIHIRQGVLARAAAAWVGVGHCQALKEKGLSTSGQS